MPMRAKQGIGLVWLAYPRYFGLREAVSGGVGKLLTDGQLGPERYVSSALDTGGVAFPFSGRLKSIGSAWTLLWYGSLTTLSGGGNDVLLSVPAAGTWVSPFAALLFRRSTTTDRLYAAVYDGASTHNGVSSAGVVVAGEKTQLYAVTYDAGDMRFYKDGAAAGSVSTTNGAASWGTEAGVVVSGRHPTDVGNSAIADCMMAAIFNRALGAGEIAEIARSPVGLVEDVPIQTVYMPPPVVPGIQYTVEMDFARDGRFAHAQSVITSRVERASWGMGMREALQEFAQPSRMALTLDNSDGAWSPEKTAATYKDLLVPGVLVRLRATWGGATYTLWTGKVTQIGVAPGEYANEAGNWRKVSITAEDPMRALLEAEYAPALLLDVRTDEAIRALFDAAVFAYPYDRSWFTLDVTLLDSDAKFWSSHDLLALETGQTTLPWAGDNLDRGRGVSAQTYLREMVAAEGGGRFFWDGRTGKFAFHNRYHDKVVTPAATLGGEYLTGVSAEFGADLANMITVQYEPRAVGAEDSILWALEEAFTLRAGQERTLTARYRDASNKEAQVSALVTRGVRIGEFQANIQEQEAQKKSDPPPPPGADVSGEIGKTLEVAASSAKVTLSNPLSVNVRISTLVLRGTPLTTFGRDEVRASDGESIADYDKRELLLTLRAIDDEAFAQGLADTHLHRRARALNRWKTASVRAGWLMNKAYDVVAQEQVVERTVGDRVRLSESWSEHDAEYIVVGEQHEMDAASATHRVTWTLKPATMETWFTLDASLLDGPDVLVF